MLHTNFMDLFYSKYSKCNISAYRKLRNSVIFTSKRRRKNKLKKLTEKKMINKTLNFSSTWKPKNSNKVVLSKVFLPKLATNSDMKGLPKA